MPTNATGPNYLESSRDHVFRLYQAQQKTEIALQLKGSKVSGMKALKLDFTNTHVLITGGAGYIGSSRPGQTLDRRV